MIDLKFNIYTQRKYIVKTEKSNDKSITIYARKKEWSRYKEKKKQKLQREEDEEEEELEDK